MDHQVKSKHFCLEYIYMQSTKLYLSKENSTSGILSKSLLKKLKKSSAFTGLKWNLNFVSRLSHASHGFLKIFFFTVCGMVSKFLIFLQESWNILYRNQTPESSAWLSKYGQKTAFWCNFYRFYFKKTF